MQGQGVGGGGGRRGLGFRWPRIERVLCRINWKKRLVSWTNLELDLENEAKISLWLVDFRHCLDHLVKNKLKVDTKSKKKITLLFQIKLHYFYRLKTRPTDFSTDKLIQDPQRCVLSYWPHTTPNNGWDKWFDFPLFGFEVVLIQPSSCHSRKLGEVVFSFPNSPVVRHPSPGFNSLELCWELDPTWKKKKRKCFLSSVVRKAQGLRVLRTPEFGVSCWAGNCVILGKLLHLFLT